MIMNSLRGQTALITGASRGIGAAIAIRLAQAGADVVINYRTRVDLSEQVAGHCQSFGIRAVAIQADVSQTMDVERMFNQLEDVMPNPLSILINNAGISLHGLLTDATEEHWDALMNVHLKGAFLCSRSALLRMVPAKYGRIVNISSIWGISGSAHEVIYSTAKGGLHTFTQALAKEVAPSCITVNAVAPGVIETDMLMDLSPMDREWVESEIPMGRIGHADEVASAVNFLCSPEASYITGQIVGVHGGWVG
jgi:3-oxoacyl-[acyl-carrier protein] reductase